jgi:hypothetical protein
VATKPISPRHQRASQPPPAVCVLQNDPSTRDSALHDVSVCVRPGQLGDKESMTTINAGIMAIAEFGQPGKSSR